MAKLCYFRRGVFSSLLVPSREVAYDLFGKYKFQMDLSMGRLQKVFFLKLGHYEPDTHRALAKLIKPGMTVLDIGANTGYFTLLMADLVGSKGRVYSFEPFPRNFRMLDENVQSNGLAHVQTFQMALSDQRGSAMLHINPINDGGHSLGDFSTNPDLEGWDREKLTEAVKTERLDDFLESQGINHVDLIKIDAEGAETLIFSGAQKLLSQAHAPILVCEVDNKAQIQVGKTEHDLREILYAYGYRSYWLNDRFEELTSDVPVNGLSINVLFAKEFKHG